MFYSFVFLLFLATSGDSAVPRKRDEPSDIVKRALKEAGVDINLKAPKPRNVSSLIPFHLTLS